MVEAKTQKSEMTQAAIVEVALDISIAHGLSAITLQAVADRLQISKSGVFTPARARSQRCNGP